MTFLVVLCEGYTEMDFVAGVLRDHLMNHGIIAQPFSWAIRSNMTSPLRSAVYFVMIQSTVRSRRRCVRTRRLRAG